MSDYKLKLKALLHDPIHKQYVMWELRKKHEEVAQEYFDFIFYEPIEDENVKTADALASAISRIIVAPKDEKLKKELEELKFEWNDIIYINIFSGKIDGSSEKNQNLIKPKSDDEVKNFFERLGGLTFKNDKERAELIFLFLWRFLPEIFPWLNTHPADSRAPNHSIYDHLVQTSAIVSALPKPAFLLFTITPVQEFIATARKTSDLWAGSYMLSYLTYKAIEVILEELGPDNVIYPNLLAQPLVDKWLYEKFKDAQIKNKFKEEDFKRFIDHIKEESEKEDYFKRFIDNCFLEEKLTIANLPNRFLAIVPFNKAGDIAEKCKNKVISELEKFVDKLDYIEELKNSRINKVKDKIKNHLKDYFQIYYVYLPWFNTNYTDVQTVLEEYKNLVGENEIYDVVKSVAKHPYYKTSNVGSAYSLLCELTERFLASRKMFRKYESIAGDQTGEKCHLCGNYDVLDFDWSNLKREIVRENERLCGVCFIKRVFPKIIKDILGLDNEIKFPSTSEMATIMWKRMIQESKASEFKEKFKALKQKVKNIPETKSVPALKDHPLFEIDGQWFFESSYRKEYLEKEYGTENGDYDEAKEEIQEILKILKSRDLQKPPTYYAILMMDGDEMGKWLKGEKMPRIEELIHPKVRNILKTVKDVKDILCYRHPVSASIHQGFSKRLTEFALKRVKEIVEENSLGKLIYAGGDDVLAFLPVENVLDCAYNLQEEFKELLSKEASMSAGIVIAHHKYPLGLALKKVREAEKSAKEDYGRDAFCVYYLSRGGEERKFGGKWDIRDFINKVSCWINSKKISKGFAYEILESIEKLEDIELLKVEIKRILKRKFSKEEKNLEDYINKFLEVLDKYKDKKDRLKDFGNMLVVIEKIQSFQQVAV